MGAAADLSASLPQLPLWFWAGGFALLGLIVGSFLATLCIRWPQGRSALGGRSACDACGKTLGPSELVPLVSAFVMRGRCRSCGSPISRVHGGVEFAAMLAGLLPFLLLDPTPAIGWAVLGWLLLPLAVLDWRELWLPNPLVIALAIGGLLCGPLLTPMPWTERLIGGVIAFAALWLIAAAYRAIRKRDGLGAGDAKLLGALGLWFGWQGLPLLLLAACTLGIAVAITLNLSRGGIDRLTALPFGTFLAAAAWTMPLWRLGGVAL